MSKIRVIARLDIKDNYIVKGIQLEGLRKIGNPNEYAKKYYEQGIDEILYMDIVASLYNRNSLGDIIFHTTEDVFIPITVGGGLRSVEDVRNILQLGADKVAINTAAIKRPELIKEIAQTFGSQCMVLSVEAKKVAENKWEVYYDNGREHSGYDVIEWVKQGVELGAGEILLTSVDKEGMQKGVDEALIEAVCTAVPVPVIASGGVGSYQDVEKAANKGASAVAVASILHYNKTNVQTLKKNLMDCGQEVRFENSSC